MPSAHDSPLVLAIDLGSSRVRVAAVDLDGRSHAAATRPVAMHFGPEGAAEEDPEEIWRALGAAIGEALARAPQAAGRIRAILCGSQYSSLVSVDASGIPVGPLMLYLDSRGGALSRALTKRHPEPDVARRILECLKLPARSPPLGELPLRHGEPTSLEDAWFFDQSAD